MMNRTLEENLQEVQSSSDLKCSEHLASLGTPLQPSVALSNNCLWDNYSSPCIENDKLSTDTVTVSDNTPLSSKKKSCLWENHDSPCVDITKTSADNAAVCENTPSSSSNKNSCLSYNLDSSKSGDNVIKDTSSAQEKNCSSENFNAPCFDHKELSSGNNVFETTPSSSMKTCCLWESFNSPGIDQTKLCNNSISVHETTPSPSKKLSCLSTNCETADTNEVSVVSEECCRVPAIKSQNSLPVENEGKKKRGQKRKTGTTKRKKQDVTTLSNDMSKKGKSHLRSNLPPAMTKLDENIGKLELSVNLPNKSHNLSLDRKSILAETKNLSHSVFPVSGGQLPSKYNHVDASASKFESSSQQNNDGHNECFEQNASSDLLLPQSSNKVSADSTAALPSSEMVVAESSTIARISPDFSAMQSATVDEEQKLTNNDDEDLFLMPPVSRNSSKRLRRNSLQLFRKSIELAHENSQECDTQIEDGNVPDQNEFPIVAKDLGSESVKRKRKNVSCNNSEVGSTKAKKANSIVDDDAHSTYETVLSSIPSDKVVSLQSIDSCETVGRKIESDQLKASASPSMPAVKEEFASDRPRRSCASLTQAIQVAQSPKGRAKKQLQPTLEDIYRNRLWRTQMPKERSWDSIPESPNPNVNVRTRKVRCMMKFDDEPNKTKLRQRRQKAIGNGWKPLTKKRLAELEKLLEAKLTDLDALLCKD